jgi:hypothetical protein
MLRGCGLAYTPIPRTLFHYSFGLQTQSRRKIPSTQEQRRGGRCSRASALRSRSISKGLNVEAEVRMEAGLRPRSRARRVTLQAVLGSCQRRWSLPKCVRLVCLNCPNVSIPQGGTSRSWTRRLFPRRRLLPLVTLQLDVVRDHRRGDEHRRRPGQGILARPPFPYIQRGRSAR